MIDGGDSSRIKTPDLNQYDWRRRLRGDGSGVHPQGIHCSR